MSAVRIAFRLNYHHGVGDTSSQVVGCPRELDDHLVDDLDDRMTEGNARRLVRFGRLIAAVESTLTPAQISVSGIAKFDDVTFDGFQQRALLVDAHRPRLQDDVL